MNESHLQFLRSFAKFTDRVRHAWLVECNPRDDCRDELIATCLNLTPKHQNLQWQWKDIPDEFEEKAKEIFTNLWPGNGGRDVALRIG
jgi:hypothetical protein